MFLHETMPNRFGSDNEDEEDEFDLDDPLSNSLAALGLDALESPRGFNDGEWKRFKSLEFREKCRDVLSLLDQGKRKLFATDPGESTVLEDFKKTAISDGDIREDSTPSALHIFAKHFQSDDFKHFKTATYRSVICYLLDDRKKHPGKTFPGEAPGVRPVLGLALDYDNDEFIACLKDCMPAHDFADLLDTQDSDGRNCIHHIFVWPRKPSERQQPKDIKPKALRRALALLPFARPSTITARDNQGNTPIHYALEYQQAYGRSSRYTSMFRAMVSGAEFAISSQKLSSSSAFNNRGESPIRYWYRTKKDYEDARALSVGREITNSTQKPRQQRGTSTPRKEAGSTDSADLRVIPQAFARPDRRAPRDAEVIEGRTPISREEADQSRILVPKTLPDRVPSPTLAIKPDSRVNDIQPTTSNSGVARQQAEKPVDPTPPKDGEREARIMLEFLERHYISTRLDLDARDLIHGKDASDINLSFDASGHKESDAVVELIDRMSFSGFGKTLAYVYLPPVTSSQKGNPGPKTKSYSSNQGILRGHDSDKGPDAGSDAAVAVFDRLASAGVETILRLTVEDFKAPTHSDAAIERAIKGQDSCDEIRRRPVSGEDSFTSFEVEDWDWRRLDMSIDVIEFAAPSIKRLNLYWSGSQVVLSGWSCPDGIPKLYHKNKLLSKVTVYASPGLETRRRMDEKLAHFKAEVNANTGGKVTVEIRPRMKGFHGSLGTNDEVMNALSGQFEGDHHRHKWVEYLEKFRAAVHPLHEVLAKLGAKPPQQVKVALIDDGVNLQGLDRFHGHLNAAGVSFASIDRHSQSPWYYSTGGHGTIMANMILRVNPWVSLHVLKLRGSPSKDGGSTFFAESAAQAIRGAIGRKVNIISMSWTVKNKLVSELATAQADSAGSDPRSTAKDEGIAELEGALVEAAKAGILMFCSASDNFQASAFDTLPYSRVADDVFRIGAADKFGKFDANVEDPSKIDYFFPGNQVAEAWNPRSGKPVEYHDGSSVGTALAAGLASMIMYCAILVRTYHDKTTRPNNPERYRVFEGYVKALQKRKNMKLAFDSIYHAAGTETEGWTKKKFLPVWKVFDTESSCRDLKKDDDKDKLRELERLTTYLCSRAHWA